MKTKWDALKNHTFLAIIMRNVWKTASVIMSGTACVNLWKYDGIFFMKNHLRPNLASEIISIRLAPLKIDFLFWRKMSSYY